MYEEDLTLNNLQGLICHKTPPNQSLYSYIYNHDTARAAFYSEIFIKAIHGKS